MVSRNTADVQLRIGVMTFLKTVLGTVILAGVFGCSSLLDADIPAGTRDPNSIKNADGAMALYRGAIAAFGFAAYSSDVSTPGSGNITNEGAFLGAALLSGLFTDELQSSDLGGQLTYYQYRSYCNDCVAIDARAATGNENYTELTYGRLQTARVSALQGIAALAKYAPETSPALRGHLYTLAALSITSLADLYCSGVPLSDVDFEGNIRLSAGIPTIQLYERANALLDTAIQLSADSAVFLNFARVVKGRVLQNVGRYREAAATVQDVPNDFRYQFSARWTFVNSTTASLWGGAVSSSDTEGKNGLPYQSSGDPRTTSTQVSTNTFGRAIFFPKKYANGLSSTLVTVADAIEARLIQAEADLDEGRTQWLVTLNALRTNGTFNVTARPGSPGVFDTLWNAGIGGVSGLRPLQDPDTTALPSGTTARDARLNLLFAERAAWLFLRGHRQGDLRRQVRQYERFENTVYPTGVYPSAVPIYGNQVSLPIPSSERTNPSFRGCINGNA